MEQLLGKLHGRRDRKVASELHDVLLTERVSRARLARWEVDFPGSRARDALMKLSDLSAFVNPPAADVLGDAAPDTESQKRMLRMALQYVGTMMTRLPDFYATRVTTHFADTLTQVGGHWEGEGSTTLRRTGVYHRTVSYRGGQEVVFENPSKRESEPAIGLTTSGEFGPILTQVFRDAVESGVHFLRWEKGTGGPAAVFGYTVPENASHFEVGFEVGSRIESVVPAYHGEIEIDPETGEILRLSAVADMAPPREAMIEVEYAPATIGGRIYMLPVKGVAFVKAPTPTYMAPFRTEADERTWPVQTEMNDVAFVNYHQFRATVRILPSEGEQR